MLTRLKQRIQAAMAYEAQLVHRIGLTPNAVTVLGFLATVVAAFLYWFSKTSPPYLVLAAVFLLVSGFFDALDGVVARLFGEVTVFGGFLDSTLDRYADGLVLIGIVVGGFADVFWGLVALMGSLLVSYSRARAEAAGVKMETIGLAERAERVIILFVASLLTLLWSYALWWSVVLLAVLTNVTVLQRAIYFRNALKKRASLTPVV